MITVEMMLSIVAIAPPIIPYFGIMIRFNVMLIDKLNNNIRRLTCGLFKASNDKPNIRPQGLKSMANEKHSIKSDASKYSLLDKRITIESLKTVKMRLSGITKTNNRITDLLYIIFR